MINKKLSRSGSECILPDDLDVYMRQFPPQGGTWHHRLQLKVTSCGRKCAANKPEPGSVHHRRHIMTSPGYTGISRRDIPDTGNEYKQFLANYIRNSYFLAPIDEADIYRDIKNLAPNKASGPDNIGNKLLKLDPQIFCYPLQLIYNKSVECAQYPNGMKLAKFVAIYKKGYDAYS